MSTLRVLLKACPNPDHGQYGSMGIPAVKVPVANLEEAVKKCREFLEEENLGGGNWAGGDVFDAKDKKIAYISFNGRVWKSRKFPCDEITVLR